MVRTIEPTAPTHCLSISARPARRDRSARAFISYPDVRKQAPQRQPQSLPVAELPSVFVDWRGGRRHRRVVARPITTIHHDVFYGLLPWRFAQLMALLGNSHAGPAQLGWEVLELG